MDSFVILMYYLDKLITKNAYHTRLRGKHMRGFICIGTMLEDCFDAIPVHKHNCWEISYYRQGSGINTIGGVQYPFDQGYIICQPPEITHVEYSKNGFRNYFLSVEQMDDFGMDVPIFLDGPNHECEQLFSQLLYIYLKHENRWRIIAESILSLLSEYMLAFCASQAKSPMVEFCEKQIIVNIADQNFSVAHLLDSIPLSTTYLMKLFKKEIGLTPNDYLTTKRIEYAKRLLSNRRTLKYRIKDIAAMCGYSDPFYFSRVFKKKTGFAPEKMFP